MFMSIGVEYGYVVNGIFEIGISSVVSLGVPGLVNLYVPVHGITGDVNSVFPSIFSLGSAIYVNA